MKDIYELLNEYTDNELDKDYFQRAFDFFMEEDPTIYRHVNKIKVCDNDQEEDHTLGNYRIDDELITIYINKIKSSKNISTRILGLEVLKHEFLHAKTIKDLHLGKQDIKTTSKKMGLLTYCAEKGLYYPLESDMQYLNFLINENYDTDPNERITEIEAWKYIVNLLKNQKTTDDLLFARSKLYYSYIRGYSDNGIFINCPTYEFLLEIRQLRELKIIKNRVEKNNYNFETRLTCGLPITHEEYNKGILNKVRLKKRKNKDMTN